MPVNNAMTRAVAAWVNRKARKVIERRKPDFVIGGADGAYLNRWYLIPRNPVFNVYLHEFMADDDDRAVHDHPWPSVSLSLNETMQEVYLRWERAPELDVGPLRSKRRVEAVRNVLPGDLVWRGARFAHRMIVPTPGALTIFITGPRIRAWGFHCAHGWRHWKQFVDRADKGAVGRGCE